MFPSHKHLKFGFVALLISIIFIGVYADSSSPQQSIQLTSYGLVNHPYISPTPGEIPIIASSPWVDGQPSSVEDLAEVRRCGFNAILSYTTLSYFNKTWRMIEESGLKAVIGFPQFATPTGPSIIDTLKNNPVIGAWRVSDEPREADFEKLSQIYNAIETTDTTHLAYINLVGSEAGKQFLGDCTNFQAFLNKFQLLFRPSVWSYDLYPITKRDGILTVDYNNFYESLESFSKMSVLTQRPFWAYCQSMAFSYKEVEKPAANLYYLSFEAFSALGYGAQGIVYWTYYQRPSNDTQFLSALKNLDGKLTPAWYAAQQVNGEIKALNSIFLNSKYIGTWHTGNNLPSFCKSYHPGVECIASLTGSDAGLQLSFLENGDSKYLLIINKDIENSQKVSLRFIKGYSTTQIEPVKGKSGYSLKSRKIRGKIVKTLPPGRYIVVSYQQSH